MKHKKQKPTFSIRKIANRNPRIARLYHDTKENIWRAAVVLFLIIFGIGSLLLFGEDDGHGALSPTFLSSNIVGADPSDEFSMCWDQKDYLIKVDPNDASKRRFYQQPLSLFNAYYIHTDEIFHNSGLQIGTSGYDTNLGFGLMYITASSGFLSGTATDQIAFGLAGGDYDPVKFSDEFEAALNQPEYLQKFMAARPQLTDADIASMYCASNGTTVLGTDVSAYLDAWQDVLDTPFTTLDEYFAIMLDGENYSFKYQTGSPQHAYYTYNRYDNGMHGFTTQAFVIEGSEIQEQGQYIGQAFYNPSLEYGYFLIDEVKHGFAIENGELDPLNFSTDFDNATSSDRPQFVKDFKDKHGLTYDQVASLYSDSQGTKYTAAQMEALGESSSTTGSLPMGSVGVSFSMSWGGKDYEIQLDPTDPEKYIIYEKTSSGLVASPYHFETTTSGDYRLMTGNMHIGDVSYDPGTGYGTIENVNPSYSTAFTTAQGPIGFAVEGSSLDPIILSDKINTAATDEERAQIIAAVYTDYSQFGVNTVAAAIATLYSSPTGDTFDADQVIDFVVDTLVDLDGLCGSADDPTVTFGSVNELQSTPDTDLCATGTPEFSSVDPWQWTCKGVNNGQDSPSCDASQVSGSVDGECNSSQKDGASGKTFSSVSELQAKSADELCLNGTPSTTTFSGSGPWTWTCQSTSGGKDSGQCIAAQGTSGGVIQFGGSGIVYSMYFNGYEWIIKNDPANPGHLLLEDKYDGNPQYVIKEDTSGVLKLYTQFPGGSERGTVTYDQNQNGYGYITTTYSGFKTNSTNMLGFAIQGSGMDPVIFSKAFDNAATLTDAAQIIHDFKTSNNLSWYEVASLLYSQKLAKMFDPADVEKFVDDYLTVVHGACGSADTQTLSSYTEFSNWKLCAEGDAIPDSFTSDQDTWTWNCIGSNGGAPDDCEAYLEGGTTDPNDPADPSDPGGDPNDPDPGDPSDPGSDPNDPFDPSDPGTDPNDPFDPSDPNDPGTDPSDPSNPGGDPNDPSDPGSDPNDPSDPGGGGSGSYSGGSDDDDTKIGVSLDLGALTSGGNAILGALAGKLASGFGDAMGGMGDAMGGAATQSTWDGITDEISAADAVSAQSDFDGITDEITSAIADGISGEEEDVGFLGKGFEEITGFSGDSGNTSLSGKGDGFQKEGVGTINAMLYNVKDYFKLVAGSMALLYMVIATMQIITAVGDEGVQSGKKNLKWSILALVAIFAIDAVVEVLFESGATPGDSLFAVDAAGSISDSGLLDKISAYFRLNARTIFSYMKTLAGAFAIFFIFLAGTHMITAAGSEEKIEKEKKFLTHAITAFVALLLMDKLIFGFIYPDNVLGNSDPICTEIMNFSHPSNLDGHYFDANYIGEKYGITPSEATQRINYCRTAAQLGAIGSNEILGVVRFFESLIGGIAIFFIVYSGITIISSMGNDEIINKHKKTLLWSVAGLVVIILADAAVNQFIFVVDRSTGAASVNTGVGLSMLASITNFIATFIGVFAVISIIVAGIIWVSNFGNTEIADKSKKIILGAVVGVVLSIVAYSIVNSITQGNPEGKGDSALGIEISK